MSADMMVLHFKFGSERRLSCRMLKWWKGKPHWACCCFFTLPPSVLIHNQQAKTWQKQCYFLVLISHIEQARAISKHCFLYSFDLYICVFCCTLLTDVYKLPRRYINICCRCQSVNAVVCSKPTFLPLCQDDRTRDLLCWGQLLKSG